MKRVMKFIWMMLFAIPMIAITSCSKDDDNEPDSEAEITIGKVIYTIDSSRNRVDFEVPITSKNIKGDLRVTYTLDDETIRIYPSDDDPDLYLFTIKNLIPGESYEVTIKATYGDVSDTEVVTFTMSDSEAEITIGKVIYTIDASRNRVDFEVPITSKNIKGELRVTYTLDDETIRIYPSDDDPDLYLFTIRDLIRGESYEVTIKATSGDVSDTEVVKFTMSDSQTSQSLFKDYSVLLGKTRQGVINYLGTAPFEQDEYSQFFFIDDFETTNVVGVEAWYVDIEDTILDKASNVISLLNPELKSSEIHNYLKNKYDFQEIDEDGYYYMKDNLFIMYFPNVDDNLPMVLYVDMQTYFPVSRAGERDLAKIKEIVKAHKHISF